MQVHWQAHSRTSAVRKSWVVFAVAAWFAAVILLAANGAFIRPAGSPPFPILLGVTLPLIVFGVAYIGSTPFRTRLLDADLRLLTAIQGWRAGGLMFIALWAHGLLPGIFAWPAGLGDIAIGVTAPWVVRRLADRPGFAHDSAFQTWNWLGILDLALAVSLGALGSGIVPGFVGETTTAAMSWLPLVLIPAFLVPLFLMLHVVALLHSRRAGSRNL